MTQLAQPPQRFKFGWFPRNKYQDLCFYVESSDGGMNIGLFDLPDDEESRALMEALSRLASTPTPETCETCEWMIRADERDRFIALLDEIVDGIYAYEKEHEHQRVKDDCCGIYIPTNVVKRLIAKRRQSLRNPEAQK